MRRLPWSFACLGLVLIAGCDERENGLGPGLSRIDRTPPAVVSTLPSQGATQVGLAEPISITFSEPMRALSITRSTIVFEPPIAGLVTVAGSTATVTPSVPLAPNTSYIGTVTTDVEDLSQNDLGAPFTWTFRTGVVVGG